MQISITNIDRWTKTMSDLPHKIANTGARIVKKGVLIAEREAKAQAPVNKFNGVRNSIVGKTQGVRGIIEPNSKIAQYIHGGTGRYKNSDRDYAPGAHWNRMRTEWNKQQTERVVAPFAPGGIRPDKFMVRGGERAEPKIQEMAQKEISNLVNSI